ncbi:MULTISPECIES: DinB family protein [unclassified Paenibacillus]|uniref:DinB family protein n=1 Tax=unclassified Paenibacillus TaxID=185978 RepID=UPI00095754CD|nr:MULTISPECIES: DinB family protein [unclassified Paenibacillus]ASS67992.1 DinB family protein [Paenibacillus sp. RUD330]SIR42062.1 DinB superfamily protein [Paenibacillus sp. RU4X]SIR52200.1 DinB superfamily protein [Paenibacillus sp. RU4T]
MTYSDLIKSYIQDLDKYTAEQLRFKSSAEVWSLGQMYDHMIAAALDYMDQVEKCAAGGEKDKAVKTEAGERLFALGGFPAVKIKLPDGPANTPCRSDGREELARRLEHVLELMQQWERKLEGIDPDSKVRHGGFGWLNAREWFDLSGMHFRHHRAQQRELEQRLGV